MHWFLSGYPLQLVPIEVWSTGVQKNPAEEGPSSCPARSARRSAHRFHVPDFSQDRPDRRHEGLAFRWTERIAGCGAKGRDSGSRHWPLAVANSSAGAARAGTSPLRSARCRRIGSSSKSGGRSGKRRWPSARRMNSSSRWRDDGGAAACGSSFPTARASLVRQDLEARAAVTPAGVALEPRREAGPTGADHVLLALPLSCEARLWSAY